jgi:hypothetical protein
VFDQPVLVAVLVAGSIALVSAIIVILRQRREATGEEPAERPLAASTEGETICPKCGMGNLWTDTTCVSCGASLR